MFKPFLKASLLILILASSCTSNNGASTSSILPTLNDSSTSSVLPNSNDYSGNNNFEILPEPEKILLEEYIYEEVFKEDILVEENLDDYIFRLNQLMSNRLNSNTVQGLNVNIINSEDDLDYYLETVNLSAQSYQINWAPIFAKLAIGSAVIITTAVLAGVTSSVPGVGFVFAASFKSSVKEAALGVAIGSAISLAISAIKGETELDNYLIESTLNAAADGFMWGAIIGASLGAAASAVTLKNSATVWASANKVLGKVVNSNIVDDLGNVVGTVTQSKFIVDPAGKVLGKLDDANRIIANWETLSLIPKTGVIKNFRQVTKYRINPAKQVLDLSGKIVGTINEAGQIIGTNKSLIGYVDEAGVLIEGIRKTANSLLTVSLSNTIINQTRIINGIKYFLDDSGQIIGRVINFTDDLGKNYKFLEQVADPTLVRTFGEIPPEGLFKIVGMLDDFDNVIPKWDSVFGALRQRGVNLAWEAEKALVISNNIGSRLWTSAQKAELIATGKVAGFQGHHINSALYNSTLASSPNNITFLSAAEHLIKGHFGNYRNVTFGQLLSRVT
jgi:hypothetical protein